MSDKKLTLEERKEHQPGAVMFFTDAEKQTIIQTVAKNLNEGQRNIFFYTCQALGLNPLLNEIAAVTYRNKEGGTQMSIQVMRDGFLSIAHRSGKFAGLESGVTMAEDGRTILFGWAKVYHQDFKVPVYQEADFSEYNTGRNLWTTKPKTMIKKVAESMALRKAFNVSGVYAPEEMEKEIAGSVKTEASSDPATEKQMENIKRLLPDDEKGSVEEMNLTKKEAAEMIQGLIMGGKN